MADTFTIKIDRAMNCTLSEHTGDVARFDEDFIMTVTPASGFNAADCIITAVVGLNGMFRQIKTKTLYTPYTASNTGEWTFFPSQEQAFGNFDTLAISAECSANVAVSYNLTHCHGLGGDLPKTWNSGDDFSVTLESDAGYTLSENISVTVAGALLDPETEYIYNPETGAINIGKESIKGDIIITAVATLTSAYKITVKTVNCVANFPATASVDEDLIGFFTANPGYDVTVGKLTVLVDGVVVPPEGYVMDDVGEFDMWSDYITGDITIRLELYDLKRDYLIIKDIDNATSTIPDTVVDGNDITGTITPLPGYDLPSVIGVSIDGVPTTNYTYGEDGTFYMADRYITGTIYITAAAVPTTLSVTTTVTGGMIDVDSTALYGQDLVFTISAASGYKLPDEIAIYVNGVKTTSYVYDYISGGGVIPGEQITGNIAIVVECVQMVKIVNNIDHGYFKVIARTPRILIEVHSTAPFELDVITVTRDGVVYDDYTIETVNKYKHILSFPPTLQGNFKISSTTRDYETTVFYRSTADEIQADKTDYLVPVAMRDITARWQNTEFNPVISVTADIPDFNFIYYHDTGKYYYVTGVENVRTGLKKYQLRLDAIMSYLPQLCNIPVIASRCEKDYDPYLIDNMTPISSKADISVRGGGKNPFTAQQGAQDNNYTLINVSGS